jgi:hypothetical protein
MPTMNAIVTEMAEYVRRSGYSVEASMGEETVDIIEDASGEAVYTLMYQEATNFIKEAEVTATEAEVDLDTAMYCEAKSYVDCI